MGFFARLLGRAPASAPQTQLVSQPTSLPGMPSAGGTRHATRRELLRVVLRETLNRHGIPAAWLSAEAFATTSRDGTRGMHWRIVVRHWDPRLLVHGIALQQALIRRVMSFDPLAANWLTGISWQFAIPDESVCPPMPHPGIWTSAPAQAASEPAGPQPDAPYASADVIAGPVRIPDAGRDADAAARADLEQLLAVRDADFQRHAGQDTAPAVYVQTEPAPLR